MPSPNQYNGFFFRKTESYRWEIYKGAKIYGIASRGGDRMWRIFSSAKGPQIEEIPENKSGQKIMREFVEYLVENRSKKKNLAC